MTTRLPILALLVAPLALGPLLAACQAPAVPAHDATRSVPVAGARVRVEGDSLLSAADAPQLALE